MTLTNKSLPAPAIQVNQKYLISVDDFFYAQDGRPYQAVWGTVSAVLTAEETLGVKTTSRSTNWYAVIGDTIIAGCKIHYSQRADSCDFSDHTGTVGETIPCRIWNADASGLSPLSPLSPVPTGMYCEVRDKENYPFDTFAEG